MVIIFVKLSCKLVIISSFILEIDFFAISFFIVAGIAVIFFERNERSLGLFNTFNILIDSLEVFPLNLIPFAITYARFAREVEE